MKKLYKFTLGVGACALTASGIQAAIAQEALDLPIHGISASISKTPTLTLGGGQFFEVINRLDISAGVESSDVKIMNDQGEEFLVEEKDGQHLIGGEVKYSEMYTAFWPEAGIYMPVPVILQGPMNIGHVNFASGSATLDSADRQLISAMADEIEHTGLKAVYLVGRTDSIGSTDGNLALSQKRVLAVKSYLVNHLKQMGITDVVVATENMGDLNASAKANAEDRRVDVLIYPRI